MTPVFSILHFSNFAGFWPNLSFACNPKRARKGLEKDPSDGWQAHRPIAALRERRKWASVAWHGSAAGFRRWEDFDTGEALRDDDVVESLGG